MFDMWDTGQLPFVILFVAVLLLAVFSMLVTRRVQGRTIALLEAQMTFIERQTNAIERIASALESKQPPQSN